MKKSKLLLLLNALDSTEIKEFQAFLSSPYFKVQKDLIVLSNFLIKHLFDQDEGKLKKEVVYRAVFPEKEFDEKHLGYLMSDLCKVIKRFLKIRKFEEEGLRGELYLLQSYLDKRLLNLYERAYKKIIHKTQSIEKKDASHFLRQYELSEIALQHFDLQQIRQHNLHLQASANYLDKFYFTSKLKHSCTMVNNQKILATEFELTFLDEIKKQLGSSEYINEPTITFYYLTLEMLLNEDSVTNFNDLKEFIYQQSHHLQESDAKYVYLSAINFCVRRIKKGERNYAQEALDLYLDGIHKAILLEKGVLSPWVYKNVIDLSLGLKQYEKVESFIHDYSGKLAKEFQENALHFNLANLYYNLKDYDKSMHHLNQTQFTDIYYNFDSKVMLIKIYYELGEEEPLLSLLASFSVFLKRNKSVSKNVKESYLNFCSLMSKITRRNTKKINLIKEEIEHTRLIVSKSWLKEKIQLWEEKIPLQQKI